MARDFGSATARPSKVRRMGSGRVKASDESGQILLLTGLAMVLMLVCVGLVVDVGHAMLVQRQLQAGVDASALAAAQELPDPAAALLTGEEYSPERAGDSTPTSAAGKNAVNTVDNAQTEVTVLCLRDVLPTCPSRYVEANAVAVRAESTVPTWFGRVIGINQMKVSAKATACSPCTSKPVDIMIVLDRSTSMRMVTDGSSQSGWQQSDGLEKLDIHNAREGVKTFLQFFDPALTKVGLAVFPPVVEDQWVEHCGLPTETNPALKGFRPWDGTSNPNVPDDHPDKDAPGRHWGFDSFYPYWEVPSPKPPSHPDPAYYTVASLTHDYLVQDARGDWVLNPASQLIRSLDCAGAEGSTSYALSIEEAKHELERNGRGNAPDIIVFLSDGAANTSPTKLVADHWTNNPSSVRNPCATGVESANRIKGSTIIYTIGYDLDAGTNQPERCREPNMTAGANYGHFLTSSPQEPSGHTAFSAIRAMATDPDGPGPIAPLFYNKPEPGDLQEIFTQIAMSISNATSRLIDNDNPIVLGS